MPCNYCTYNFDLRWRFWPVLVYRGGVQEMTFLGSALIHVITNPMNAGFLGALLVGACFRLVWRLAIK